MAQSEGRVCSGSGIVQPPVGMAYPAGSRGMQFPAVQYPPVTEPDGDVHP